ncbi:IclR family transcriptional regulator domain-containing protein [Streptomyces sp. TP-A0874]|uniref:IclR family transcriptional regulator domain-containing protein n=1 Tax=Streptomyces sp. TP-A0874 TaxID=549819 RepID=UPI000A46FC09|nr:IclR family transcriptional regulator C-terminal domain-containing protein [Streptomyces sp. TP-A0874]
MSNEGMAGLAKGLAVLEAFGTKAPRLTISDAAGATGLSRAAARRCLMTLTELGYVTFDGKFFSPTPRVLRLGATYEETAQLPQLAQPHLVAIRDTVDESASLAVLQDDGSLFVARSETTRMLNTGVRVGARLPLYASATGHVLLAGLADEEVAARLAKTELLARTPTTPTDPEAIAQRVREARKNGYALTDEELELGLRSIAVPVADSTGATVAALSVSAATARVSVDELRTRLFPVIQEHAVLLSRQL